MADREYDTSFDNPNNERPYMIFPKVYGDSRGSFTEVLAGPNAIGIQQVNRSVSCQLTVRGMHAQRGAHCQSKIVESLTLPIYDIITDARPDSKTFGRSAVYCLDPISQNKLYVPHGFLHGFAVPKNDVNKDANAAFMYYCDQLYCKESEIHVNPMTILPTIAEKLAGIDQYGAFVEMMTTSQKDLVLSEKDLAGENYIEQMMRLSDEYSKTGRVWYKI